MAKDITLLQRWKKILIMVGLFISLPGGAGIGAVLFYLVGLNVGIPGLLGLGIMMAIGAAGLFALTSIAIGLGYVLIKGMQNQATTQKKQQTGNQNQQLGDSKNPRKKKSKSKKSVELTEKQKKEQEVMKYGLLIAKAIKKNKIFDETELKDIYEDKTLLETIFSRKYSLTIGNSDSEDMYLQEYFIHLSANDKINRTVLGCPEKMKWMIVFFSISEAREATQNLLIAKYSHINKSQMDFFDCILLESELLRSNACNYHVRKVHKNTYKKLSELKGYNNLDLVYYTLCLALYNHNIHYFYYLIHVFKIDIGLALETLDNKNFLRELPAMVKELITYQKDISNENSIPKISESFHKNDLDDDEADEEEEQFYRGENKRTNILASELILEIYICSEKQEGRENLSNSFKKLACQTTSILFLFAEKNYSGHPEKEGSLKYKLGHFYYLYTAAKDFLGKRFHKLRYHNESLLEFIEKSEIYEPLKSHIIMQIKLDDPSQNISEEPSLDFKQHRILGLFVCLNMLKSKNAQTISSVTEYFTPSEIQTAIKLYGSERPETIRWLEDNFSQDTTLDLFIHSESENFQKHGPLNLSPPAASTNKNSLNTSEPQKNQNSEEAPSPWN